MIRDEFVGDDSIVLPVTFDYKGGRSGNLKSSIILFLITIVACILASIVIFNLNGKPISDRWIYFIVLWVAYFFFARFIVFKEKTYRDYLGSLKKVSSEGLLTEEDKTSDTYWGIFDINDNYPHECYYVDGKRAIFVSLSKDIFIGKGMDVITRHYDAISDAYNLASRNQVDLVGIDYMDTVGNDTRMTTLYSELGYSRNEKLKYFVGSLYKGLSENMEGEFASYDVYCIVANNKNVNLQKVMMRIVTQLLEGNYVAYKVLDEPAIRQLCSVLTNNKDFSLLSARDSILRVNNYKSFKPLFVVDKNNNLRMIGDDGEFQDSEDSSGDSDDSIVLEDAPDIEEGSEDAITGNEEFDIF